MVRVRVSEGELEGEKVTSELVGTFYSFKGIPYAEPPLGDLRFKAPQPPKPWNGVRSAKEHGPVSYQLDLFLAMKLLGSEDCLYLNVYTPNIKPTTPLPVMFWIHGGGFSCGSGNDDFYGPEYLLRQDVILVTINYRLDILGFLCLDTEDIPGNAGMKDQVAALRWVKQNISNFGGDPDNVTIFGESAGGASVSYHLLSPMSKGLFKRAITQSGTALCNWAIAFQPRERAIVIARELGLDSEDDKELYDFFKSVPYESLAGVPAMMTLAEKGTGNNGIGLSVTSEKDFGQERFFYGYVLANLQNGIHKGVEVMSGYCEDEGVLLLCFPDTEKTFDLFKKFLERFVPKEITTNCSTAERFEIGKRFKKFYFGNDTISKENYENLLKFTGTEMFTFPLILSQKIMSSKNTVYLYKFTCKSERNLLTRKMALFTAAWQIVGDKSLVVHCDDLPYIFPMKFYHQNIDKESKEFKMIENVTTLWTNFAKYGNPTPDNSLGAKWIPYTVDGEDYLDIGEELVADNQPEKKEYEFWENIYKQYLPRFRSIETTCCKL